MRGVHLIDLCVREHIVVFRGKGDDVFDLVLLREIGDQTDLVILHGTDNQVRLGQRILL